MKMKLLSSIVFVIACLSVNKHCFAQSIYTIGLSQPCDYLATANPKSNTLLFRSVVDKIAKEGGGVLNIKEGLYLLDNSFEIGSNTEIQGSGMDKTILKLADKSPPFQINGSKKSGFVRSKMTKNNIIRDLTLDGNKVNQKKDSASKYGRYGLFTEGCENVLVDNVKIKNFQGYGFDPHGWKKAPGGPKYGKNIKITNCIADNNDWDGFTLDQSYNYLVENCLSTNNGRHGYNFCTGTKDSIAKNNVAINNGWYYYAGGRGCSINVVNNQQFGTGKITLTGNILKKAKTAGVCLNDVYDINVSNNEIYGNGSQQPSCMYFEKVKTSTVKNNKCPLNSYMDTKKSPTGVTFTGNTFTLV
jgi:hypothetical protein